MAPFDRNTHDDHTNWSQRDGGFESTGETPSSSFGSPWPGISPLTQAAMRKRIMEPYADIDFDAMPSRPIYHIGSTSGFEEERAKSLVLRLIIMSEAAGRPLTQPEVDAISMSHATSVSRNELTRPVSILVAMAVTYRGRKTLRFPFFKPSIKPSVFPHLRLPIAKGPPATMLWHVVRWLAYFGVCHSILSPGIALYSQIRSQLDISHDTRMSEWKEQFKAMRPEGHKRDLETPRSVIRVQHDQPSNLEGTIQGTNAATQSPPEPKSSGLFGRRGGSGYQQKQPVPPLHPWQSSEEKPKPSAWDDKGILDQEIDDGSPISPSARAANHRASVSAATETSNWAQIRQKAQAGQQQDRPNKPNKVSLSPDDTDRKDWLDASQAQREFEASLEAERQRTTRSRWNS